MNSAEFENRYGKRYTSERGVDWIVRASFYKFKDQQTLDPHTLKFVKSFVSFLSIADEKIADLRMVLNGYPDSRVRQSCAYILQTFAALECRKYLSIEDIKSSSLPEFYRIEYLFLKLRLYWAISTEEFWVLDKRRKTLSDIFYGVNSRSHITPNKTLFHSDEKISDKILTATLMPNSEITHIEFNELDTTRYTSLWDDLVILGYDGLYTSKSFFIPPPVWH